MPKAPYRAGAATSWGSWTTSAVETALTHGPARGLYTCPENRRYSLESRSGRGLVAAFGSVTAIDQGGGNYAAIREDGSLWLWGDNRFGQIAPGGVKADYVQAPVKAMDGVKLISLNGQIMAIKNDDTLWSWVTKRDGSSGPQYPDG